MIGIDEVGRGAWAGPLLVVAASKKASHSEIHVRGLTDSKKLSATERSNIFSKLTQVFSFGEGWVSAAEIDTHGLSNSLRLGTKRALNSANFSVTNDHQIIIDGNQNFLPKSFKNVSCIVRADESIEAVSAASVYAKVTRDKYMKNISKQYSEYMFSNNVGYGTAFHQNVLSKFGPCELHRMSYRPVQQVVMQSNNNKNPTATGAKAEHEAAVYLSQKEEHIILALNWRHPRGEIDIVSKQGDTVYFTEVKYRKNSQYGAGLEYITNKKVQQMKFAASLWLAQSSWQGKCQLSAIALSGPRFEVTEYIRVLEE